MLLQLFSLPLLGSCILFFLPKHKIDWIRCFSFFWTSLTFLFSILFLLLFDTSNTQFQFYTKLHWTLFFKNNFVSFGLDGLSCWLIVLTSLLVVLCSALSWNFSIDNKSVKLYNMSFFILELFLFVAFSSLDLIIFYISFEAVLIPMYFIIGFFGSRNRRTRAAYLLFFYTLFSSVFFFLAILFLFFCYGTVDYLTLKVVTIEPLVEKWLWVAFFFSFAVKIPLFPFHIWLPEAHCEAPTGGSVILAGILLKLGCFGFLRYSLGLFPESCAFFTPFMYSICAFGSVFASLTTIQQVDLKKIIAYSSVGHMAIVTLGIFSFNNQGILGSITLLLGHGIVSSGLFLCIGFLYERHNTRIVKYFSGLVNTMPLFSFFFFLFTLGNIGFPGTCNFVGEFLILLGTFQINCFTAFICGFTMILTAGYSLWLFNRVSFGNVKPYSLKNFLDLNRLEVFTLFPLACLVVLVGFFPSLITVYISMG